MTEYVAKVRFTRSYSDDASAIGVEQPTAFDLAKQLARELQEAYDELSIAGEFQVETITLNGINYPIG